MRNILLFFCIVFFQKSIAQLPMAMPPEADSFYTKAMPLIKLKLKTVIVREANSLKNRRANADSLFKALHSNPALKGISDQDLQGIATLIMVQASRDADDDLKKMVLSMRNNNTVERTSNVNNPGKTETQESINDAKQLMLQMIIQRKSRIAEEISFVMKKISDDRENIINNLK